MLQSFGRRVRELSIHVVADEIDPSVYILLVKALGENPLLPNIRNLTFVPWFKENVFHGAILNLLFSPSLRKVYLAAAREILQHHNYSTFARRLVGAPGLNCLNLVGFSPCQKVLDGVLSLKNISEIELDFSDSPNVIANRTMLLLFGTLECLSSLTITLPEVNRVPPCPTTNQTTVFSKLVDLELYCSFEDALQFWADAKLPSLQKLHYMFRIPDPPLIPTFRWKEFLDGLMIATTSQFTSLKLRSSAYPILDWVESRRLWAMMETYPSVSFHSLAGTLLRLNLTCFEISFPFFESLCAADFAAMGAAWPNMTRLQLHTISLQAPISDTSVLRIIATAFPRLVVLVIDMNAERIDKPSLVPFSHPLGLLVVRLVGCPQTVTAKLRFAALVDSLFPNLRTITDPSFAHDHIYKQVDQIEEFLEELQSTRKRERNRIRTEFHLPGIKQHNDDANTYSDDEDDEDF
ncbi:hypothetical protein CVT24_000990 [Panaeolus cyanescens]|uniref:F-box domain-containing protein n=1 Tax=Panaeolus cyanescens TaxID=181874 RepID=A0A409YCH6_9AGAR|nr:hypothetical protein CVT24_000990 [Panaeolus cyanescens]